MDYLGNNLEEEKQFLVNDDKCDKYDYLIAVGCGAIGGLIDIFLVGTPGESQLCNLTDSQVNEIVKKFAKKNGWNPKKGNENNVKSAIGFLERHDKHKINYDQRLNSQVQDMFDIAPNTHHMMSLAHSPDPIGLFFSILNQFTSTSTFIADGRIVTIDTETFELQGGDFISKIMCGIANWFWHLMSDVAGASGAHGRGSGIVIPFYELFGLLNVGKFSGVDNQKATFAEIAQQAFIKGYDARFGMAMAIPVVITDLSIRLIWCCRRFFQKGYSLKDCIPVSSHADLRVMILVGNGTLCAMDGIDAAVRSGGNFLAFFMRLNLVAWLKMLRLVLKEIAIRLGMQKDETLNALKCVDAAMDNYLQEIKEYDIENFEIETANYNCYIETLANVNSVEDLNKTLTNIYDMMDIPKAWNGDLDDFMSDSNNQLVFE